MARKIFDQQCKKTFATKSTHSGLAARKDDAAQQRVVISTRPTGQRRCSRCVVEREQNRCCLPEGFRPPSKGSLTKSQGKIYIAER
jgi:hypothetical protein